MAHRRVALRHAVGRSVIFGTAAPITRQQVQHWRRAFGEQRQQALR